MGWEARQRKGKKEARDRRLRRVVEGPRPSPLRTETPSRDAREGPFACFLLSHAVSRNSVGVARSAVKA